MRNERLRALLLERGETPDKLAEAVGVDAKTVERWITKGRTPYRSHRYAVATFLGVDESYIWPDAMGRDEVAAVSESEIVAVYPHRWALPRDTLGRFFSEAEREIGALVYAGIFIAEDMGVRGCSPSVPGPGCGSGSCWGTRTARTWPGAAWMRGSAVRCWRLRSGARWCCSGRCWASRGWRSGCMDHLVQLDLPG